MYELGSTFKRLSGQTVPLEEVNAVIKRAWGDLALHPKKAERAGLSPTDLKGPPPLIAQRAAGGSDLTPALIAIAVPLAKDALEALWKLYVWPMIQAKFGTKINEDNS